MKKVFAILLSLCMILSLCACGVGGVQFDKTMATPEVEVQDTSSREARITDDIIILHTNDVHCAVSEGVGYKGLIEMKDALEAAGKTVLLVSSGDYIQGDLIGLMSDGEDIITLMNDVGYDAVTLGNHEFDYGVDQILKLKDETKFPILCCNFLDKDGNRLFDAYKIIDVNGVKVAFIGITTPQTLVSSTPKFFQDEDGNYIYSFATGGDVTGQYFYDYVQKYVDEVKEQGADYVVALAHLGIEASASPYTSSELIPNVSGLDIVLDGHSHTVMESEHVKDKDGNSVLVTQTGTRLEYVGLVKIGQNGVITSELINDEGIQSAIDAITKSIDEKTNEVIAHTDFDLVINDPNNPDERIVRYEETNLGDLLSDAYRSYGQADIGIVTGGSIRAALNAGDISYKNLISVLPFSSNVLVIKTSGQSILDALECSVYSVPNEYGSFMHVSGLTFTADISVPTPVSQDANGVLIINPDADRRVKDVMVNGEPLDPAKDYTVASLDYTLVQGGDGIACFNDAEVVLDTQMLYLQVFIEYITDNLGGAVPEEYADPYGQGRITIING